MGTNALHGRKRSAQGAEAKAGRAPGKPSQRSDERFRQQPEGNGRPPVRVCVHSVNRLHAHESLVEERGAGSGIRPVAACSDRPGQDRSSRFGQYGGQGASGRDGGSKKNDPQAIGKSRGGWTTKIHMVAANARTAITFTLSPGHAHDAPEGRKLLRKMGKVPWPMHLLMDGAYEGDETRQLALDLGFIPVVPPKQNRVTPWEYDRAMYKRRNEIERLFRRLKGFRRIFSRFEKLDVMFVAFINFALIVDGLR